MPIARFLDLVQHFFVQSHGFDLSEQAKLNTELTGVIQTQRIDDRGIAIPVWWVENDTTVSSAAQTLLDMKGWGR